MENKSEPYISVIYQLLVLAIGSPMPARAIKLLRDPPVEGNTIIHSTLSGREKDLLRVRTA